MPLTGWIARGIVQGVTDRPSLDEIMSRSTHEGPIWRHQPSLRHHFVGGLIGLIILTALRTLGLWPEPPFDAGEWMFSIAVSSVVIYVVVVGVDAVLHFVKRR
jgi:hypothetical protein